MGVYLGPCYDRFKNEVDKEVIASGVGAFFAVKCLEEVGLRVPLKTALAVYWGGRLFEVVSSKVLSKLGFGRFPLIERFTVLFLGVVSLRGRVTLAEKYLGLSPLTTLALSALQSFGMSSARVVIS